MTKIALTASRNISRRDGHFAGYDFHISDTDEAETGALEQVGAVENDIIRYRGVFASRGDALRAALSYVGHPCKILSVTPWGETHERLVVQRHDQRASFPEADIYVAASHGANGKFVAHD